MLIRLLALSAFLLSTTATASAMAQPSCGDRPRSVIQYLGFNPDRDLDEDGRHELELAVGALIARFNLRCGYRVTLNVDRRSGDYEVRPEVDSLADACDYSVRVREGTAYRSARGRRLADALTEAATLGVEVTPAGSACPDS